MYTKFYAFGLAIVALPLLLYVNLGVKPFLNNVSIAGTDSARAESVQNIQFPLQRVTDPIRESFEAGNLPVSVKNSRRSATNDITLSTLRLKELERSLVLLSQEYTDAHPDIISLKEQIAEVKAQLEEKPSLTAQPAPGDQEDRNPTSEKRLAHDLGEGPANEASQAAQDKTPNKETVTQPTAVGQSAPNGDGLLTEERFEAAETGRLLTVLLDAGRVVVGRVQTTINNPRLEDKGFSSVVFQNELRKELLARTGQDLRNLAPAAMPERAKPLLVRLTFFMQQAIQEVQPLINQKGVGFKGFVPETFAAKVAEQFSKDAGLKLRQIGPPGVHPRNPNNRPDGQEVQALLAIQKTHPRMGDHVVEQQLSDNTVRILLPLFYKTHCLACHGKPKKEVDISGYEKEGFKKGDLGGAISVVMPLDKQLLKAEASLATSQAP